MSDICILSCLQPKQDRTGSNIGLFLHVEFQPWINSRLTDENWVRSQELYYRCTIQPELLQTAMKNLSFSNNIHLHQHPSPGVWIVQIKLQYYFTTTYTRFLCLTRVGTKVTSRHRQIWEKLDFWITNSDNYAEADLLFRFSPNYTFKDYSLCHYAFFDWCFYFVYALCMSSSGEMIGYCLQFCRPPLFLVF